MWAYPRKFVIDVPSSMLTGQSDFDCVCVASILFTTYFRGKEFTFALILPYTSVANNMQYICQPIPVVFFCFTDCFNHAKNIERFVEMN